MAALAVIPVFVRSEEERDVTIVTLRTLRDQEPDLETLVVDDGSPSRDDWEKIKLFCEDNSIETFEKETNSGFSATVNVGLQRALDEGKDAILLNADMEFTLPFVQKMTETTDSKGRPAAMVGALLTYPNGLVQHGGIFFSLLTRGLDHRFKYAPASLPEVNVKTTCPVTGAMQFIRHSTLETVGLYDEDYLMAFEDVDACIRVFEAGLECVYNPEIKAIHHESFFRSKGKDEWHQKSLQTLYDKQGSASLGQFVPPIA